MIRRLSVVLAVLVAGAGLMSCGFTGGRDGAESGYRLTAYFDRGVSLYRGGDVRVLGLPAGEIASVEVEGRRVKVEMRMKGDVPVPPDVQATIVPLSLIGERYVQLSPVWTSGSPRAEDGAVIPLERTSVPVEPDEALAALKDFLDALDPSATGRLVKNLADTLEGNGADLNRALEGVAELTSTLAEKDQELASIVDSFDDFSATLVTREQQLGRALDGFAITAAVLADERRDIERLVKGLAQVSVAGLDLVSEHRVRLDRDLQVLTRTLQSVDANLGAVRDLLSAAPITVAGEDLDGKNEGLAAAHDPVYHRIDLRNTTSPVVADLLEAIGLTPGICLPAGVACPPGVPAPPGLPIPAVAPAAPADDRPDSGLSGWLRSAGRSLARVVS